MLRFVVNQGEALEIEGQQFDEMKASGQLIRCCHMKVSGTRRDAYQYWYARNGDFVGLRYRATDVMTEDEWEQDVFPFLRA